jgi:hypothetical protein
MAAAGLILEDAEFEAIGRVPRMSPAVRDA